jgi:hypothetical protein
MAAALLCLPSPAQAAKVRVWHHSSPAHYEKARFKQTVISSEGALRLSRRLRPLASVRATHVWDVVEDKAGNLVVATGDEGKIFRVTPDGRSSVVYTSEDSQVLCLALASDGTVYAGTGPSGQIVRIGPDGAGKVHYRTSESYVWCLAVGSDGQTVYVGTGPKGRIYEVTAQGKARVFYTTKQDHILSMATGPDGMLYAGTDKDGLVYRIDARGKGFVLYSATQAEVRRLLATPDGIYAGTSSPARRRAPSSASASRGYSASADGYAALGNPPTHTRTQVSAPSSSSPAYSESNEKGSLAAWASPPAIGENSLYRIAPDGTVRELFREKTLVLSLLRQNGRIFIGTGMEGQLFEVEETTKERSEIARLDNGQIHCLYRRHDGAVVLGTGDPGKLFVLEDKYAARGTVISEVLDAKLISKWGSLSWQAETPAGTAVSMAARSGNTAEPDSTWSDWSVEQTNSQQATIAAPPARFLQYRVTLTTTDPEATPTVHSLALRYMTTNLSPEVSSIQVPDLDAANLDNSKKLRFKWTASDPNDDELSYALYVRKESWENWVQLEEDYERTEYEWDTTTAPAGLYRLKVVASDRRDNPAEDCLSASRVSAVFAVAHEAPTVTVKYGGMERDRVVIEGTAADPLVRLTSAAFAVNGKKWLSVFPTDGLFDSNRETFRFKTDRLKPGTYVVVLRVRDAAGNTGSGDMVFTVPAKNSQPSKAAKADRQQAAH